MFMFEMSKTDHLYDYDLTSWPVTHRVGLKIEIHEIHEIHQNLRNPVSLIGLQFLQLA